MELYGKKWNYMENRERGKLGGIEKMGETEKIEFTLNFFIRTSKNQCRL